MARSVNLLFYLTVMSGLLVAWFAYQANEHPSSVNTQAFTVSLAVFSGSATALIALCRRLRLSQRE